MNTIIEILDKKLKNNEPHLISHILSFIQCKCHVCKKTLLTYYCMKVYHDNPDCKFANTHKFRCIECSEKGYYVWCPDMCLECTD